MESNAGEAGLPWKKHVRVGDCNLYLGNSLDVLEELGSFDVVMTDPPYSSGGFQEAGKSAGSIGDTKGSKIAFDNLSTRGYGRLMRRILLACSHADEAYVFTDWRMWIETFDALEDGGFRVRSMIVWDKKNAGLGVAWRSQHELVGYGKKTPVKPGSPSFGNVITVPRTKNVHHPTQKPSDLIERLLAVSASGVVVDPFMGSGTTGVACAKMGRSFVGIELSEAFFDTACERIEEEYRQRDMFVSAPPDPKQEDLI